MGGVVQPPRFSYAPNPLGNQVWQRQRSPLWNLLEVSFEAGVTLGVFYPLGEALNRERELGLDRRETG